MQQRLNHLLSILLLITLVGLAFVAVFDTQRPGTATAAVPASNEGPSWLEVTTFAGFRPCVSAPFLLRGGEYLLCYTVRGTSDVRLSVTVRAVGSGGSGDAPLAGAAADRAGEGRLRIAASEGEHEIAVESAHCEWSMRLLQLVDR
jgi:hypothetical protein